MDHDADVHESRLWDIASAYEHLAVRPSQAELAVIGVLQVWKPFNAPEQRLLDAMQHLASVSSDAATSERCVLRSQAMLDLLYEQEHLQGMSDDLKYHAVARYRLSRKKISLPPAQAHSPKRSMVAALEALQTHPLLNVGTIAARLSAPCHRHGEVL